MSGRLKFALHSLTLALFLTLLAAAQTSQTASATNAESRKTASGVFSASGHPALAFSACNPGQPLGKSGLETTTRTCAFSYGKEADQLSRLSYYGYRYYDPLSLQWTQADPLFRVAPDIAYDEPRRMSLYTFSLNNPVRYMDPDGRNAQVIGPAALAAGAGAFAIAIISGRGPDNAGKAAVSAFKDTLDLIGEATPTRVGMPDLQKSAEGVHNLLGIRHGKVGDLAKSVGVAYEQMMLSENTRDGDDYDADAESNEYHDNKGSGTESTGPRNRARSGQTAEEAGARQAGTEAYQAGANAAGESVEGRINNKDKSKQNADHARSREFRDSTDVDP